MATYMLENISVTILLKNASIMDVYVKFPMISQAMNVK